MSMILRSVSLVAYIVLTACDSTSPPQPPKGPAASATSRLRAHGGELYVTALPDRYPRGAILYALDVVPLPGATTHPRIGLVQVTEPRSVRVGWYCHPKRDVDAILAGPGLPVEGFTPDTTIRVGKCWGRYLPGGELAWDEHLVDLTLNLGEGDGVKDGDLFEVLGDPIVDTDNRTITGFERLGQCAAQPFEGSFDRAICRLDRYSWPKFTRAWWLKGGFVRFAQKKP